MYNQLKMINMELVLVQQEIEPLPKQSKAPFVFNSIHRCFGDFIVDF